MEDNGIFLQQVTRIIKFIKKLLRKSSDSYEKRQQQELAIDSKYIIPRKFHNLSKTDINANALKVLNKLNSSGFKAYLVGGSVRDLLLGKVPKDFDIATNATPNEIRGLFRNARIIGRRFKLAHIIFYREIVEVATFRAGHAEHTADHHQTNEKGMIIRDNVYGDLDEDALRRDFTANSLYYDINSSAIIDFTGGFQDLRNHILRTIGDPIIRYQEDPVRMLRAIRFGAKLDFALDPQTAAALSKINFSLKHVSGARLFDEITKLYKCGEAEKAHLLLIKYNIFPYLFAQTAAQLENSQQQKLITSALKSTDRRIREGKPVNPAFLFAIFLWFPLQMRMQLLQQQQKMIPIEALEKAMTAVIIEQNSVITVPRRFSQVMREMWLLQYRFPRRLGQRAIHLLQHPRFRAAYDLLYLRSLAGDEDATLTQWWTDFQEVSEEERRTMITALMPTRKAEAKKKAAVKKTHG